MPANLENTAVATGLEKVSFHSNPKERQCQRMLKLPHNCTHLNISLPNCTILLLAMDSTGVLFTLITLSMLYGITI